MPLMTVGEAARAVDVSTKAIRYWEAKGLIPRAKRTAAGYRMLTDSDLVTLRFIRQAKTLGLALDEIEAIIQLRNTGTCPCDRVAQAINAQLLAIDRSIAELLRLRGALGKAKQAAATSRPAEADTIVCHIIESVDSTMIDRPNPALPYVTNAAE